MYCTVITSSQHLDLGTDFSLGLQATFNLTLNGIESSTDLTKWPNKNDDTNLHFSTFICLFFFIFWNEFSYFFFVRISAQIKMRFHGNFPKAFPYQSAHVKRPTNETRSNKHPITWPRPLPAPPPPLIAWPTNQTEDMATWDGHDSSLPKKKDNKRKKEKKKKKTLQNMKPWLSKYCYTTKTSMICLFL